MTVINLPSNGIKVFCDLCPTGIIELKHEDPRDAAKDAHGKGWKTLKVDKDTYTHICPDCVDRIK